MFKKIKEAIKNITKEKKISPRNGTIKNNQVDLKKNPMKHLERKKNGN